MSVFYCEGDIFLSQCQTIAHGCNCAGKMGAGIAKEIRRRFPECYQEYWTRCHSNRFIPGDYYLHKTSTPWILNLATQYGTNGADLELVTTSLHTVAQYHKEEGLTSIAMPRIAAGLGGLTWETIKDIIQETMGKIDIPIFVYEEYKPDVRVDEGKFLKGGETEKNVQN